MQSQANFLQRLRIFLPDKNDALNSQITLTKKPVNCSILLIIKNDNKNNKSEILNVKHNSAQFLIPLVDHQENI